MVSDDASSDNHMTGDARIHESDDEAILDEVLRRMAVAPILEPEGWSQALRWAHSSDAGVAALGRNVLVDSLLRLAVSISRTFESEAVPLAPVVRCALNGVVKAVEKFDPASEFKLQTYAAWFIRQAIAKELGVADE
jgi:DNA-directed RNA polymerase sigma subunit (sigma70/sigma32)